MQCHHLPSFLTNFEDQSLIGFSLLEKQSLFENDSIRSRQSFFKINESALKHFNESHFDYSIQH